MSDLEARIRREVGRVVTNSNNWPEPIQVHMWGRDLAGPINMITEALAPVVREAQAESWDECVHIYDNMVCLDCEPKAPTNPYRVN